MKTMNLSSAHSSRAFVGPLLIAGSVLMMPHEVRAQDVGGHWVLDHYELAGTSSGAGAWPSSLLPDQSGSIGLPVDRQAGASGGGTTSPVTIELSHSGNITPVFKWVPDNNDLQAHPAPDKLIVKMTGSATTAYTGNTNQFTLTPSLNIGSAAGTPSITSTGPYGKNVFYNTAFLATASNSDHQVLVKAPKDGIAVNGGVTATLSPGQWSPFSGGLRGGLNITATKDDRSVMLTRGVNDAQHPDREYTTSGVVHGDTTYSYYSQVLGSGVTVTNSQAINATLLGVWTKHVLTIGTHGAVTYYGKSQRWSYSGNAQTHDESQQSTTIDAPTGNLFFGILGFQGSPSGAQQQSTTYTITDDDGATATAKYYLSFHDPVEKISDDTSQVSCMVPIYRADGTPIYTSPQTGVGSGTGYVERSTGYSVGAGLNATFNLTGWLKFLGIDVGINGSFSQDTNTGATVPFTCPPNFYAQAYQQDFYTRHHYLLRHFDTSGLIARRSAVEIDPKYDLGVIIPDEAWNDVYQSSSIPTWQGPIYGPIPPNQGNASVPSPPKPSYTFS